MQAPRSLWQRWTGQQPVMEIRLVIGAPEVTASADVQVRSEVCLELRPRDCNREQAGELVRSLGPMLVESLRAHLRSNNVGRTQERMVWHHPLLVCSMQPDGAVGPAIECQGKDLSLNGIGFYLPGQLPSSQVMVHLPQTTVTPKMSVPARVVRAQGCGDGWYEVGAVLLPPHELPPDSEEGIRH
jgi:hypothetical protein